MKLNFWEFLLAVGMFKENKDLHEYSEDEKIEAKSRYLEAISSSIQGSAAVILKRKVKDFCQWLQCNPNEATHS